MAIEDLPYNTSVDDFATEDKKQDDEDQPNKSVLLEIQKYLATQIAKHNSFDVITPEAENIMTTQQQVEMHRQVVSHLRDIKSQVDNKIKELR